MTLAMGIAWASVYVYGCVVAALGGCGARRRAEGRTGTAWIVILLGVAAVVAISLLATTADLYGDIVGLAGMSSAAAFGVVGLTSFAFGTVTADRRSRFARGPLWVAWVLFQLGACTVGGWMVCLAVAMATDEFVIA